MHNLKNTLLKGVLFTVTLFSPLYGFAENSSPAEKVEVAQVENHAENELAWRGYWGRPYYWHRPYYYYSYRPYYFYRPYYYNPYRPYYY